MPKAKNVQTKPKYLAKFVRNIQGYDPRYLSRVDLHDWPQFDLGFDTFEDASAAADIEIKDWIDPQEVSVKIIKGEY